MAEVISLKYEAKQSPKLGHWYVRSVSEIGEPHYRVIASGLTEADANELVEALNAVMNDLVVTLDGNIVTLERIIVEGSKVG